MYSNLKANSYSSLLGIAKEESPHIEKPTGSIKQQHRAHIKMKPKTDQNLLGMAHSVRKAVARHLKKIENSAPVIKIKAKSLHDLLSMAQAESTQHTRARGMVREEDKQILSELHH